MLIFTHLPMSRFPACALVISGTDNSVEQWTDTLRFSARKLHRTFGPDF